MGKVIKEKILVRFGELTLKSDKSRRRFLNRLIRNIENALDSLSAKYRIENLWSRLIVEVDGDLDKALNTLKRVFGIHSLAVIKDYYFKDMDDLVRVGVNEYKNIVKNKSFAVRVRRTGKHPFTSMDIARILGEKLRNYAKGVELKMPEVEVRIEIRDNRVFYYKKLVKAYGGLPVGTEGIALALVSGGFDSAVAAWYTLKRGAIVHYVFCNLNGEGYKLDVINVMRVLSDMWSYGYSPKLYIIDFNEVLDEIKKTREDYWNVILRRMMYRAAEYIAKRIGAKTIVTGESLGQVSSQTLTNLYVSQLAIELPINRPLFGMDKEEIINIAREIGTYEYSAKIQEYCAIIPEKPVLYASKKVVRDEEDKIDMKILWNALENMEIINLKKYVYRGLDEAALNTIPSGYKLIDIRSEDEFKKWHYPAAINIPVNKLQQDPDKYLSKNEKYLIYCDRGVVSKEIALILREMGYDVHYFIYGLPKLKKICELMGAKEDNM